MGIKNIFSSLAILSFLLIAFTDVCMASYPNIDSTDVKESKETNFDGKLYLPLDQYKVSSVYGYRYHPQTKKRHFHAAIDLDTKWGTPVYAAEKGVVVSAGWTNGLGYNIKIDHGVDINGNSLSTLYAHLSKVKVKKGDNVLPGQIIGKVGSTGQSTGSHLHFEVHQNNVKKNPAVFFKHHKRKQFYKYTIGGCRRMMPLVKLDPVFPQIIPLIWKPDLPKYTDKEYLFPLIVNQVSSLRLVENKYIPKKIEAPIPENLCDLQINSPSQSSLNYNERTICIKEKSVRGKEYGVQISASITQVSDERLSSLKKKYGNDIRTDYDGKYYRYTLMGDADNKFKTEEEARNYIKQLNNEGLMGVICYDNSGRKTIAWQ